MAFTVESALARASAIASLSDASGNSERALMLEWLNEGVAEVFKQTHCVVTKVDVTLVAGQDEYALDRGVLMTLNYAQVASSPSGKISVLNAADMLERKFLTGTGSVRYFCVLGGNLLIVSPAPEGDDHLNFYAVPVPDEITTGDVFTTGLPTYGQRAVECYLNERCFEHQRDYERSAKWGKDFQTECGGIRVTMRKQAGTTLPLGRIGYPDRVSTPSRNDTYSSL